MQKKLFQNIIFASLLTLSAGCSFPGVYKLDIQQGNIITQNMIDQLRPGMTSRQVRFIMGTPITTDVFSPQRWDYIYSIQPGGGRRYQEQISLFFDENDQLIGLSGDFLPGISKDQEILGVEEITVTDTTVEVETIEVDIVE